MNYKNRNIYILPDSQAAIKAIGQHQITSELVCDCYQSLIQMARHNRVQLVWVPGHEGIAGNETADLLTRRGTEHPSTGPEPSCGISVGFAKKALRIWTKKKLQNKMGIHNWTQTGKGNYIRTLCQKNKGSVEIKQDRLRWIVGLFTGQCHIKGHFSTWD
jgi:hypothetical protein